MIRTAFFAAVLATLAPAAVLAAHPPSGTTVRFRAIDVDGRAEITETRLGSYRYFALSMYERARAHAPVTFLCEPADGAFAIGLRLPKIASPAGDLEVQVDADPVRAFRRRIGNEGDGYAGAAVPLDFVSSLLTASTLSIAADGYVYIVPIAKHRLMLRQLIDTCRR